LRKVEFIFFLLLLFDSCAVIRKGKQENDYIPSGGTRELLSVNLKKGNVSAEGYFIEKAEIHLSDDNGKRRFFANMKYTAPATYLLSLRSVTGLEIARVYISGDSVLINDRINKVTYEGNTNGLVKKYGIKVDFIPVLLGDYIDDNLAEKVIDDCKNGQVNVEGNIKGMRILYIVDCRRGKVISARPDIVAGRKNLQVSFSDFIKRDKLHYPRTILITDSIGDESISVSIVKFSSPWYGNIKFIPGAQYEKKPLL